MYNKEEHKHLFDLSKAYLDTQNAVRSATPSQQVQELHQLINYHEWRYYVQNDPIISDFEYDHLFKYLEELEGKHPELITNNSPTQRVSNDLIDDFAKVSHLTPMLSLANSYNAEDLKEFDEQIKRLLNMDMDVDIEYVVEPKFDGGSIALVYENDALNRGATRGNGQEGDEITANARVIRSVPLKAEFSRKGVHRVELRGEVVIHKDKFKKINEQRAAEDLTLFANARNTATGGLRMKDPKEVAQRGLEAFLYTLGYAVDTDGNDQLSQFETHSESIAFLGQLGFKVPKNNDELKVCKNIEEVAQFCFDWEQRRESYDYEIDGMVVKVNNRVLQERVGYTSHHPRWAIAYKFKAKQATTKLVNVEYQVGKIGSITPVAKVEPVGLAGVTISSISLHNEDFILEKDLHLGDTVLIERAGDVIPYIVKSMEDLRDGSEVKIEFPKQCPINTTDTAVDLTRVEGEAAWRCPNCVCGAQDLQRMIFHVSKPAMNIDGLGKSLVERFFELGWVKNMADIYRLDYEKVASLEGFGERSAANLKASIEKAKQNPIYRLLHSLSVHHLGKKVSKLLAAEIKHVLDLQNWTEEDYTNIKDVGPKVAENVMQFFQEQKNIDLLKEMEAAGVNMTQTEDDRPVVADENAPLFGKTILFTGSLQQMSRKEAQSKAEAAGAKNISAVSSKLNILVVGEKAGSKLKKAQALGTVEILTEEEFVQLMEG
jgi:DNA ligase (NAD+)